MAELPALFNDPVWFALLTLVVVLLVLWQRTLTWPEYRRVHALKRRVLPVVDRYTSLFVVSRKGGRDDREYVCTRDATIVEVFSQLRDVGLSPHLVNSLKVRPNPDGEGHHYSAAHLVFMHDDGMQTEVYLFENDDGTTDAYAHFEAGVANVDEHLEGPQRDGDVRGVLEAWVNA